MVRIQCPNCGIRMDVDRKYLGKRGRCNKCHNIFTVPAAEDEPKQSENNPFADPPSDAEPEPAAALGLGGPEDDGPFAAKFDAGDFDSDADNGTDNPFAAPAHHSPGLQEGVSDDEPAVPVAHAKQSNPFANDDSVGAKEIEPEPPPPVSPEVIESNESSIFSERPSDIEEGSIFDDEERRELRPQRLAVASEKEPVPAAPEPRAQGGERKKAGATQKLSQDVVVKYVPSRVPASRSTKNFANHKVQAIEAHVIELPARADLVTARGVFCRKKKPTQRIVVKAVGTNGLVGWAEVTPGSALSGATVDAVLPVIRSALAPAVAGLPACNVDGVVRRMDKVLPPETGAGNRLAKAAIDMAVHDLFARTLEVPLHVLLGGKRLQSVSLSYVIAANSGERATALMEKGLKAGYHAFKIVVGVHGESADREIIAAALKAAPTGASLSVAAHGAYRLDQATKLAQWLDAVGVDFFDQPYPADSCSNLSRLAAQGTVPIALSDTVTSPRALLEHVRRDAVDLVVVNPQHCGGHRAALKIATIAEAAGLRLTGCGYAETDLGIAHCAHLFAALGVSLPCDLSGRQLIESPFVKSRLTVEDGALQLPVEAGCGVEVDEQELAHYIDPSWEPSA